MEEMKMANLYVDLHVIQTVPPSCVNRDDTGSPKTAIYGGVRRARVSSQSWKRAIRLMFRERFCEEDLGVRTKDIVNMVAEEIIKRNSLITLESAQKSAEKIINDAEVSTKDSTAKALFFMSPKQAAGLAELTASESYNKKEAQDTLNNNPSIDIALFGRMVADSPILNTDATAQVAHAISTHRVENEFDYFTAVDDRSREDNAGAGMIGTVEFNSSTLYRFATVALHELAEQLGGIETAAKAVAEFARAFVLSMPDGKINTFANRTVPDAVYITLRNDMPVNFAGAFEKPIRTEKGGYAQESAKEFAAYANKVYSSFAEQPMCAYVIGDMENLGVVCSLNKALEKLECDVKGKLQ
jgi:CRISPR system Cascade subunit CasC